MSCFQRVAPNIHFNTIYTENTCLYWFIVLAKTDYLRKQYTLLQNIHWLIGVISKTIVGIHCGNPFKTILGGLRILRK